MATFSNIAGQEPSTVTFRVGTVQIARGSTNEQQEILVLGDPETSNAIARVVAAEPDSTHFGAVVRQVGYVAPSTVVSVSTGSVRVHQSTAADLQATVGPASTVWAVQAAQAGAWTVRANFSSTAADNPVSVSGYSTTVNVSSVGGVVAVTPNSTVWAVQLGNYSTVAAVSSLAGRVAIAGFHAVSGIVNVTDSTNNAINVNVVAGSAAGSTITTVSQLLDSSGGSITAGDSANQAIRVNVVAGAAGGSTIVTVSTGSVRVHQSTAADLQATVGQASTVWAVQITQYSTTANVSSVAGVVVISPVSTASMRVAQSTAADLQATVTQASTVWAVQVGGYSTIVSVAAWPSGMLSTAAPSSNSSGVIVRQVVDAITTVASTAACASTSFSVQSSAASLRTYVTAYTVLSTVAAATKFGFYSSNNLVWPLRLQAVSSGITGANLAVAAPGYLFRSEAAAELTFRSPASTVAAVSLGVSYFIAP